VCKMWTVFYAHVSCWACRGTFLVSWEVLGGVAAMGIGIDFPFFFLLLFGDFVAFPEA